MPVSHPRFDLPSFEARFPLEQLRDQAGEKAFLVPKGRIVTSPFHVTSIELLRRETLGQQRPDDAVPVDVFVFDAGEPPAPYLTKIGGVPFRSRRKPWPTTSDGRALGFVGQICFIDSRDIIETTPGDVALVFVDVEDLLSERSYLVEWVDVDEEDPMSKDSMPEAHFTKKPGRLAAKRGAQAEVRPFQPFVCHGVIHRTVDLPTSDAAFNQYESPSRISVFEATKIGGVPHRVQEGLNEAGRFVASIGSVQPAPEVVYPWVNDPSPLTLGARHALPTWQVGDMGSLYIFDTIDGTRIEVQSY